MYKHILTGAIITALLFTACDNSQNQQTVPPETVTEKSGKEQTADTVIYESESLVIHKISRRVYRHISYLTTKDFGKVACNGMLVLNNNEAIVFDTPGSDESSAELIDYFTKEMNSSIKAIIATHFHGDCVGGLKAFHQKQIPSYASSKTIQLLKEKKSEFAVPQHGFDSVLTLPVGDKAIIAEYFGEGHTKDNIIGYFPAEKIMFGGCLVKETGAGKGNLEDANTNAWPSTINRIREKYPNPSLVIPGHGKPGGTELLDYTIKLFQ